MCRILAVAREAGLGSLSLYFAIHGKGTVTLTLELVLYFRKLPLRGLEGVPGLPGAPQDEAGLTRKFDLN